MDWAKLLDKFFVFIAALIPGGFVLLVGALRHSGLWGMFWSLNYLGYQTKVGILIFAAFAAGLTVNEAVSFMINFAASSVASYRMASAQKQAALKAKDAAQEAASGQVLPPAAQPAAQPEIPMWRSQTGEIS